MRRCVAMLLLLVFGAVFAAPLVAQVDADAQLPMCCRKGGLHHCMASMGQEDGSAKVRARCCAMERFASSVSRVDAAAAGAPVSAAAIAVDAGVAAWFEARVWTRFARREPVRGPPVVELA